MTDTTVRDSFTETEENPGLKQSGSYSGSWCFGMSRRFFLTILSVVMTLTFYPIGSWATEYECQTKQVVWWHNGKVEPSIDSPGHKVARNAVFHFDDETGSMVWQFDKDSAAVKTKFEMIRKEDRYHDVVAINRYIELDGASISSFQIYADQASGETLSFLQHKAPGGEMVSGSCTIVTN